MNHNQNAGMQKRMLLFTVIVFVLFLVYEFTVLKPQQEAQAKAAQETQAQQANNAPQTTNANMNTAVATPAAVNNNSVEALSSKAIASKDVIATIETKQSIIEIDTLGRIAQVTLTESKYIDEEGEQIKLFEANQLRPLEVRFGNTNLNTEAFKVSYTASAQSIDARNSVQKLTLTQNLSGTTVSKEFTFFPAGHYELKTTTTNKEAFFITNGFRPNVLADMYADHGLYVKQSDGILELTEDEDLSKNKNYIGVTFVSNFDRYYATVLFNFNTPMQVTVMPDNASNPQAFIHGNDSITLGGYVGPKEFNVLKAINPELTDVIEYGWFTFIAKPMFTFLQFIQSYVGNWGWTIVILTLVIKLILYPLSYKGMVSMQKMKDLAPKMKELQAKYKDDKQKQSAAMMELYKKHGANPMGGCLPLLLQIPVFFAIYRVLLNAIELKGAPWMLWIEDLALMDPYFVLPILMGASMYLQQKITPNTMQDEMQKKIFQFLPVIFTFFFLWFPAGLTLYWFVNNVFTIAQQYYINKLFEKKRALKK
jgi:YidC/Oxa1 family membrane protein insertase